ncbi:hypothetical protein Ancab_015494 [Ancistrocladus abbreviatus]
MVDSSATSPLISSMSAAATEGMEFVAAFESEYDGLRTRPNFVAEGFMGALQRSRHAYKLLFVYLHSPEHPDTPVFCERIPCNEAANTMSNSLKASRFPFCAVVMAAMNQRIALLQQLWCLGSGSLMLDNLGGFLPLWGVKKNVFLCYLHNGSMWKWFIGSDTIFARDHEAMH